MNNNYNINQKLKDLKIDQSLSGVFILLSIISITGDEFVKKYYINKNKEDFIKGKKLFICALSTSLLIYLYFLYKNKQDYFYRIINNKESFPNLIRVIGSLFLVVGIACLIYYQINDDEISGVVPL